MSGVSLTFDPSKSLELVSRIQAKLNSSNQILAVVGEELHRIHRARFAAQISPDGVPWKALQPWYREQKHQNQDKVLTLRGHLSGGLRYQISNDSLLFGTNTVYGAIHQFGGTIKPVSAKYLSIAKRNVKQVSITARPWLGISKTEGENILELIKAHFLKS